MTRSGAYSSAALQVLSVLNSGKSHIPPEQIAPVVKELVLHGDARTIQKLLEKLPDDQETCTRINQGATEASKALIKQKKEAELEAFNFDPQHSKQSMYFMQGIAAGVWTTAQELARAGEGARICQIAANIDGLAFPQQGLWRGLVYGFDDAIKAQNQDLVIQVLASLLREGLFRDVAAIPAIAAHLAARLPHLNYQEIMACLQGAFEFIFTYMATEGENEELEETLDEALRFPDLEPFIKSALPSLAITLNLACLLEQVDTPSWQTIQNLKDAVHHRAGMEERLDVGTSGFMAYISTIGRPVPEYVH